MKTNINLYYRHIMKRNYYLCMLAAICGIMVSLNGCKQEEPQEGYVEPPAPPYMELSGTVTNEEGQALAAIQVSLDSTKIERNDWGTFPLSEIERKIYTDKEGGYRVYYDYIGSDYDPVKWPLEITIVACDTTGLYETQTKTVPVENRIRYPNYTNLSRYVDGIVTANFVLKKR